jgi:spore cortex biosynthesis protein YabQ
MQNNVTQQLIEFFNFVVIGILLAIIFDFFRAYRKYKMTSAKGVLVQDIIYFVSATGIIIFSIIYVLDSNIRLYIFLGIFLGIMIYIGFFSKYFMKIYNLIFKVFFEILTVVFLPIKLNFDIIFHVINFLRKNIEKSCKKFFYMVDFKCKSLKSMIKKKNIDKRG